MSEVRCTARAGQASSSLSHTGCARVACRCKTNGRCVAAELTQVLVSWNGEEIYCEFGQILFAVVVQVIGLMCE